MLNSIAEIGPRIVSGRDAGLHASGHSYRCCPSLACMAQALGPEAAMLQRPTLQPAWSCTSPCCCRGSLLPHAVKWHAGGPLLLPH